MIELLLHNGKKQRSLLVPENWNELSGQQFVAVTDILYSSIKEGYELGVKLCKVLCGLSWGKLVRIGEDNLVNHVVPLTAFLTQPCNITAQVLPFIKTKFGKFYGPKACIENFRVNEFHQAEFHLNEWHKILKALPEGVDFRHDKGALEHLYLFVACLYRPAKKGYDLAKDPDGDMREDFNYNLAKYHAQGLPKSVSINTALAIMLFYKGCRALLPESFPDLFNGNDTEEGSDHVDYFSIIRAVAKESVYGNFDAVETMYVWNLFYAVQKSKEEYDLQREEIERMKQH